MSARPSRAALDDRASPPAARPAGEGRRRSHARARWGRIQAVRRRAHLISPIAGIGSLLLLILLVVAVQALLTTARRDGGASSTTWTLDPGRSEPGSLPVDASTGPRILDHAHAQLEREPAPDEQAVRPSSRYRHAAAAYGVSPALLEAVHQVESGAAPDSCVANLGGSGAVGPFQFKPATFRRYAVDGNGDGVTDICSFVDALFSAAHYLRSIGADTDLDSRATRAALVRYGTDASRVIELARHYARRDEEETRSAQRDAVHGSPSGVNVQTDWNER